jgi:hypothetical protein
MSDADVVIIFTPLRGTARRLIQWLRVRRLDRRCDGRPRGGSRCAAPRREDRGTDQREANRQQGQRHPDRAGEEPIRDRWQDDQRPG